MKAPAAALVASLLSLQQLDGVSGDATVFAVQATRGSMNGGTRVTLLGAELDEMGRDMNTKVYFGSDECRIEWYDSSDDKIVCWSPAHAVEETVRVAVFRQDLDAKNAYAACSPASACSFQYRNDRTPRLDWIGSGGGKGSVIRGVGPLMGSSSTQYEVNIGAAQCLVDDELQASPSSMVDWTGTGVFKCLVGDQEAGYYNMTVRVDHPVEGYGYATMGRGTTRVAANGVPYHFVQHPVIEGLSYVRTGLGGGTLLKIRGGGFSWTPENNVVTIGDVPCTVVSSSLSEITCRPGPASSAAGTPTTPDRSRPFTGGRGLLYKRWAGSGCWPCSDDTVWGTKPGYSAIRTDTVGNQMITDGTNYYDEWSGFFVPPISSNYSFFVRGDDMISIELGMRGGQPAPGNWTTVASLPNWSLTWIQYASTQLGAPVYLEAGKRYPFRMRHGQGVGGDSQELAIRMHATTSSDPGAAAYLNPLIANRSSVPDMQIVTTSATVVREVQTLTITGAEAGNFLLLAGGALLPTNSPNGEVVGFSVDATGATLAAALNKNVGGCNAFSVSRTSYNNTEGLPVRSWAVTFGCSSSSPWPALSMASLSLKPVPGARVALDAVRTTAASAPLGGTFRLQYGTQTTSALTVFAGSGEMRSALMALDGVGAVDIAGPTGNCLESCSWYVTFFGLGPNVPLLTAVTQDATVGVTGLDAAVTARKVYAGSWDPLFWPAPADFFEVAMPLPVVTVRTNGILGSCDDANMWNSTAPFTSIPCGFQYDPALTAYVDAVDQTSVQAGDVLTVTGSGFLSAADGIGAGPGNTTIPMWELNKVYLNDSLCNVTYATSTQLKCTVQHAAAGTYAVQVEVGMARGFALYSGAAPQVSYPLIVAGVAPSSGSMAGGQVVTFSGTGFAAYTSGNVIRLGSQSCEVQTASFTQVTCVTPAQANPASATADVTVPISVNGVSLTQTYTFSPSKTPIVGSIDPPALSSAITGWVNVTVSGIPAGAEVSMVVGERRCSGRVLVATGAAGASVVSCRLLRGPAPPLPQAPIAPRILVSGLGAAAVPPSLALDVGFRVDSMSASTGSFEGGHRVTFRGVGFATTFTYANEVTFRHTDALGITWYTPCPVVDIDASGTALTCVTPRIPTYKRGRINATQSLPGTMMVRVNNITAPCATGLSDCAYTQAPDSTPVVNAVYLTVDTPDPNDPTTSRRMVVVEGSRLPASDVVIKVGGARCDSVTAIDIGVPNAMVSCFASDVPAGPATVEVGVESAGIAAAPAGLNVSIPLLVSPTYSINSTGVAGGRLVTFTGTGFSSTPERNAVRFGPSGTRGVVVATSAMSLTVRVPPLLSLTRDTWVDVVFQVLNVDLTDVVGTLTHVGAFGYFPGLAPSITSVTPASGTSGTVITIKGSNFGSAAAPASVTIGGAACAVDIASYTASSFNCTVGATPGGRHRVTVSHPDNGYARHPSVAVTFTASLTVRGHTTDAGAGGAIGLAGGQTIKVQGSGFPSALAPAGSSSSAAAAYDAVSVRICNTPCIVTASSYSELTCVTSPASLQSALSTTADAWQPTPLKGKNNAALAFDGAAATTASGVCAVDMDMGPDTRAVVTKVGVYSEFKGSAKLKGGAFKASVDGVTWDTLASMPGVPVEGWNDIWILNGPMQTKTDLSTAPAYRYLRFAFPSSASGSACRLSELRYIGYPVVAQANGNCPLNVTVAPATFPSTFLGTVAGATAQSPASVPLSLALTPTLKSITPNNGTALGGDLLSIKGTGFGSDPSRVTVSLNGIPCSVTTVTPTEVKCITGRRDMINPISVDVVVSGAAGGGEALYDADLVYFRYLDRWSSPNTWKYQEPPVDGDSVYIPAGQSVLVDVSSPLLNLVLVEGDLVFDRRDLTFDATYLFIRGGTMLVGSEREPFLNKLTITLHGDRYDTIEIPEVGAKGLTVTARGASMDMSGGSSMAGMGVNSDGVTVAPAMSEYSEGVLELHGKPVRRVWTRLAATAPAGTKRLTLEEDVDWQPGDKIIVTRSRNFYDTEELTVASVPSPRTVIVVETLKADHEVSVYSGTSHSTSDIKLSCEVALLSRNVVIQGDEKSERQMFGVHTGAFHHGVYHVENVEIRRAGQAGQLGRYPTHTHELSDTTNYVRFNSIHHTYQRATTVHATNYMEVKHNVAYHTRGHTVFVEDGIEQYNVIEEYLVVHTEPCQFCTVSDVKPANFWTASPTNFWRHNVAAGSTHFGFWFELPSNPLGPSYTSSYCPVNAPLGQFHNNTAHSSSIGLRIYPQYRPTKAMCDESTSDPQYFTNNTYYHNGQGTFHRQVGDVHHQGSRWVENGEGFGWRVYEGGLTYGWDANIKDSVFICATNDAAAASSSFACGQRAIIAPQSEWWYIENVRFVNYGTTPPLAGCHSCDDDKHLKQGGYTYRTKGLTWVRTAGRTFWNEPKKCIFWDQDGTLTGYNNGYVTAYYAWNNAPECSRDTSGAYTGGTVCDGRVAIRRFQLDGHTPQELDYLNLNVTSAYGWDSMKFRPKEIYGWVYPGVVSLNAARHNSYMHTFVSPGRIDWRTLRFRYSEPEYIQPAEWTYMNFTWIDTRYRNLVMYQGDKRERLYKLPEGAWPTPADDFGTGNLPAPGNKTFAMVVSTKNITGPRSSSYMVTLSNIQCPPGGCPIPPTGAYGSAVKWSDPSTWPGGVLPTAGSDVLVNTTQYIIMDINPPKLGKLTVLGRLEFQDNADRLLEADTIAVWGELVVGTPASPFLNSAEIRLYGQRESPSLVLNNNLFLSNKVLAVLGKLTMHGRPRVTTWTKLAATAKKGDTTLTLTQSVAGSWFKGDRIVLSPTEFDHTQLETVTITAVNGASVTIDKPLAYSHYSGPVVASTANGISNVTASARLQGAVGLLTRNVVISGKLSDASDVYGASVYVAGVTKAAASTPGGEPTRIQGSVDLRYVEFRNTGKQSTEHPSLSFQYGGFLYDPAIPATNPINVVEGCAFSDSFNYGIVAMAAKHIRINGTVFHRHYRNALDFDSNSANATITNSLVVGAFKSPDVNMADQYAWARPAAGILMNVVPGQLTGTVVTGSWDAGFTYLAPPCSQADAKVAGNEAHGVRIGVYLLPTTNRESCIALTNFTVWKAAHHGILSIDQQADNVRIKGALVSDNHIGVYIHFYKWYSSARETRVEVSDSVIVGSSPASSDCGQSSVCRAMTKEDPAGDFCGSVLGSTYRRAGLMLPESSSFGKTCTVNDEMPVCRPPNAPVRMCAMPWEKRTGTGGQPIMGLYVTNTRFVGFNGGPSADCGASSRAIVKNPSHVDISAPVYLSGVAFERMPIDGRFDFNHNDATNEQHCEGNCDAHQNVLIQDMDGSVTGTKGGSILGPNPALAYGSSVCASRASWNGFECAGATFRGAVIGSHNAGRVKLGAMQITRIDGPGDNRTTLTTGPVKEACTSMMWYAQYPHVIVPGRTTQLFWPATEPPQIYYNFLSPDPTEKAVISLFMARAFQWTGSYGGVAVAPKESGPVTIADPVGTWNFDPQARRLTFVVQGGASTKAHEFLQTAAVQLTVKLAISVEEFFSTDFVSNLAVLLGINPLQIKVVSVQPGSVQATVLVLDTVPTVVVQNVTDTTGLQAAALQTERLKNISAIIETKAATGQLDTIAGITVTAATIEVPLNPAAGDSLAVPPSVVSLPVNRMSDDSVAGLVVGLAVGLSVGGVALVVTVEAIRRRRRNRKLFATREATFASDRVLRASFSGTMGANPLGTGGGGSRRNLALTQGAMAMAAGVPSSGGSVLGGGSVVGGSGSRRNLAIAGSNNPLHSRSASIDLGAGSVMSGAPNHLAEAFNRERSESNRRIGINPLQHSQAHRATAAARAKTGAAAPKTPSKATTWLRKLTGTKNATEEDEIDAALDAVLGPAGGPGLTLAIPVEPAPPSAVQPPSSVTGGAIVLNMEDRASRRSFIESQGGRAAPVRAVATSSGASVLTTASVGARRAATGSGSIVGPGYRPASALAPTLYGPVYAAAVGPVGGRRSGNPRN